MPTDPTPPAPAPLTESELARLHSMGLHYDYAEAVIRGLLADYDATRAELARERAELAEVNAFRAEPLKAIRNLIGEEDQDDEALLGSACTIIVSWKGLAANKKKAEAERDAARAALERLQMHHVKALQEAHDADAAGRALVAAAQHCVHKPERGHAGAIHDMDHRAQLAHAIAQCPTRWRTGEGP